MSNAQVLLLIAAFVTLTLGSFIWFIVTWDADNEKSISQAASPATQFTIISPKILAPQAIPTFERATT
ncbi:hypothetical protein [Yoonia sp. SS1-5]|uniref:Uncharacterized protein n=1 Tax=Yoonia rhodophyticola TaxID=3137370 RepID=A0AAN0NLP7_9RHOB